MLYFVVYTVVVSIIMINLFVAVPLRRVSVCFVEKVETSGNFIRKKIVKFNRKIMNNN